MSEASMAMGLMTWWAAACRVGAMHTSTHRPAVIRWHQAVGLMGLVVVMGAAARWVDPWLAFNCAAALLFTMLVTLREWRDGPPVWTWRPGLAMARCLP
jgi:hypothetical protein